MRTTQSEGQANCSERLNYAIWIFTVFVQLHHVSFIILGGIFSLERTFKYIYTNSSNKNLGLSNYWFIKINFISTIA